MADLCNVPQVYYRHLPRTSLMCVCVHDQELTNAAVFRVSIIGLILSGLHIQVLDIHRALSLVFCANECLMFLYGGSPFCSTFCMPRPLPATGRPRGVLVSAEVES